MNTEKVRRYAELEFSNPGLSKTERARLAGFSPNSCTYNIEQSKTYKDIREETRAAAAQLGISPAFVFGTLKRSMNRSTVSTHHDNSANQAAKIAGEFLGMSAPVQVDTTVKIQQQTLAAILDNLAQ